MRRAPPHRQASLLVERWLAGYLAGIADDGHAQIDPPVRHLGSPPGLRASAERNPVSRLAAASPPSRSGRPPRSSGGFRARPTLASCSQADIDAWHAENSDHIRRSPGLSPLVHGQQAHLPLPVALHYGPGPGRASRHERISHLGRVLTDGELPLRTRAAAAIVLLYAQPVSRIVRITTR